MSRGTDFNGDFNDANTLSTPDMEIFNFDIDTIYSKALLLKSFESLNTVVFPAKIGTHVHKDL